MSRSPVIVGVGMAPYVKRSTQPAKWFVVDAIARSVETLGLSPGEITGLAITSFQLAPDNVTTVAQDLGIELGWAFQGAYGGASGVISVIEAARAIRAGDADVVICAAGDSFDVQSHNAIIGQFSGAIRDYLAPGGFGGTNGLFAALERRHSRQFGTKKQQLARIAVTQRHHAQRNPRALLREPLSEADYLSARIIAEPLGLYDCVMPCAGGDAVLMMTEKRAAGLGVPYATVLSGGQRHNYAPHDYLPLTQGWTRFAPGLFQRAGITLADVDCIQLYDDYPIMVAVQLEDLGFCEKGSAGAFLECTDLGLEGELPLNTGGGQLSMGQAGAAGGMVGLVEAACQLLGKADDRQIEGAQVALVSGFGMVSYGRGLSCAAVILGST